MIRPRQFIYFLHDSAGEVLYVGRSQDVATRIRSHYYEASNPDITQSHRKALWLMDVRRVSMTGPLAWDAAVAEERRLIEDMQPHGNIRLTSRDPNKRVGGYRRALRAAS